MRQFEPDPIFADPIFAIFGICSLESANKLAVNQSTENMADSLAANYVAGLRGRLAASD